MKKFLLPLLAIVALLAACVPSVNPFYTDKDVITDPRLAGTWIGDEGKDDSVAWKFESVTNNFYAVLFTEEKNKTGKFEGRLFKLGEETLLDLTPTECNFATNQASIVSMAIIPGHLLLRVKFLEQSLSLAFCDPDWVGKFLEKNPTAIAHRKVDGNVILTAETAALQKFVLKHLGEGELFGKTGDYKRAAAK